MKQSVQVTILGQQYTVRSESSAEEVNAVADFVNQKIAEVARMGRTADSLDTVVLALLNVAGTYLQMEKEPSDTEVEGRLKRLLEKVEGAGEESPLLF